MNKNDFKCRMAQIGLSAKGVVYIILAAIAFMAAFSLRGQSKNNADSTGAFKFIEQTGGTVLLSVVALGLICYCIWRVIQAFDGDDKWYKRLRYLFSALAYSSVAFTAIKLILNARSSGTNSNQKMAAEALSHPLGIWLVGLAAVLFAAVGIYHFYYALSDKYRKKVSQLSLNDAKEKVLLNIGKVGYLGRGCVWILIAILLYRAAKYHSASAAGGTAQAFGFVSGWQYGTYILAAIAVGVAAYGLFCFIRAKYQHF